MKILMTATPLITTLDGIPVRVWEGVTERGVSCLVFVHRVALESGADREQFERELCEQTPPGSLECC